MFQFHSVGSFYKLWYYSSCSMTTSQLANKDVFFFTLLFLLMIYLPEDDDTFIE